MSTEAGTRRERTRRRRSRAFLGALAVAVAALAVVGLAGAAVTTMQGPRATSVSVDPDAAATAAGSRVIFTTTQSLAKVDPAQVTVSPATPFTVDTSGRSVGIRFALPLWDDTEYTVTVADVTGVGGGTTATLTTSFSTPALHVYVLQRSSSGDTVVRSGLDGSGAEPVFTDPQIEDFRATADHLVVSTMDRSGHSHLVVTDLDGQNPTELPLPGPGTVSNLQSADKGNLIGYTFTDADVGTPGARESLLFTASLAPGRLGSDPVPIARTGGESRVDDWRFVPGTDSILMLTFDGALTLVSPGAGDAAGAPPVALGNAVSIDGIARGSTSVVVERIGGPAAIDLATAQESTLAPTDPALGELNGVTPLPDDPALGGTSLRTLAILDGFSVTSTTVNVVDAAGAARTVFRIDPADTLIETCVSPSARYAAFLVAPHAVDNPYDAHQLPLPATLQTHIVALADGTEVGTLKGFDISWCQTPPRV